MTDFGLRCSKSGATVDSNPSAGAVNLNITATPATMARYHELFTTNDTPGSAEITLIRSIVSDTDTRLACLDEEISRLRIRLKSLEEEHASLSSYRAQNKGILSPLRRMPAEVLGEIFSWTLPSATEARDRDKFSTGDSPWVLTQISSRWRTISVSIPSLWSRIDLDDRENPLAAIETQIQRAQTLKIRFYMPPDPQMQMFELLTKHSLRWEELSLGLNREILPLLATVRHRVPRLRRLWMEWDEDNKFHAESMETVDCFLAAPSLVHLGVYDEYHATSIPMPVHQLTQYELAGPVNMHLGILKQAKSLVQARIFAEVGGVAPSEILALTCLRRLYVSDVAFLEHITAPALEELAVDVDDGPTVRACIGSFVDRSSCSLRRLCLRGWPDSLTIVEILLKAPSIMELAIIIYNSDSREAINAMVTTFGMSGSSRGRALATRLRSLSFGCKEIDYPQYLEMMKSWRNAPGSTLESAALAVLEKGPGLDPATRIGLGLLRQGGLDLLLVEGPEAANVIGDWYYNSTFK
ncbi:hypothetical protein DFH07DRAFT_793539 [Mycena maculata]|uniref:F-box domain-containing protein n=1 Tax=Mycena maculata TaxID=230809 RepID=A0AAD7K7P4_9AGAR|nr:hypothetical protein DFH07DRAFT_793539 [Mycena maculata]